MGDEVVRSILSQYPAEEMVAYQVSTRVNTSAEEGGALVLPVMPPPLT